MHTFKLYSHNFTFVSLENIANIFFTWTKQNMKNGIIVKEMNNETKNIGSLKFDIQSRKFKRLKNHIFEIVKH